MKKVLQNLTSPLIIIILAALFRLLPHEPNFTPIGAMALFGGANLPKKYALILPLAAMFISDIFLGFHSTMIWVYGSFVLISLLGVLIRKKVNFTNVILVSAVSSTLFFTITNFGVWFSTSMYPKTLGGLWESYLMGLPFLKNTFLGDLFYNGLFFGGFYIFAKLLKPAFVKRD